MLFWRMMANSMKERNYNLDLLRIFACLLIVCMHAPLPSDVEHSVFLNITGYFPAAGLCVFFVLSGALLLPVKTDTFTFLKRRLGKIVIPTLCFTVFYIALRLINGEDLDLFRTICSVPFSNQGHGVLWYMYTLVGLYLLSPIISKWLRDATKREVEFYLSLWLISQCYPMISLFAEINTSNTGVLYYFSGYAGYFLLGYYLKAYPNAISWKILSLPLVLSIIAPVGCKMLCLKIDFYSIFWYLSIFVTILTVALYKVFMIPSLQLKEKNVLTRLITTTSELCFGIYLIHIAVMREWLWKATWIADISNFYVQYIVIVGITFVVSLSISYVISFLPFGQYIIGFKHK